MKLLFRWNVVFSISLLAAIIGLVANEDRGILDHFTGKLAGVLVFAIVGLALWLIKNLNDDISHFEKIISDIVAWLVKFKDDAMADLEKLRASAPSVFKHMLISTIKLGSSDQVSSKLVTSMDLTKYVDQVFEDKFENTKAARFGGSITGVSLIFTFALIAPAVIKIGQALDIKDASSGNQDALLKSAIIQIGSKFLISATGVLFSLLVMWELDDKRKSFFRRSSNTIKSLSNVSLTHEEALLMVQTRALSRQEDLIKKSDDIISSLGKLESIKVDVTTLGNEVITQLKGVIKDSVGEQIERLLDKQSNVGDVKKIV